MNESSDTLTSQSEKQHRTVFFISDGTAITAETLGHSLLSQFPQVEFDMRILPYVDNESSAFDAVGLINQAAHDDELPPLVFDTLVDPVL
ncbi:MAG TPA: kinase/pyrophosphorylase, partial [Aquirhabdus sp.]